MKSFDCFMFFNELDLLELRLETLNDYVDHFVILEAPWCHNGKPKPLHFLDNSERYRKWFSKIRHLQLAGDIETNDPWVRERFSRDAMLSGFNDAEPDDFIFHSDLDEIWRPEKKYEFANKPGVTVYGMDMFYYHMNRRRVPRINWYGTRRIRFKEYTSGRDLRLSRGNIIQDGGWHFSFLGGADRVIEKMKSYAHSEYSGEEYTDRERIKRHIDSGVDVFNMSAMYNAIPVDDTFPAPLVKEPERWKEYLWPVETSPCQT